MSSLNKIGARALALWALCAPYVLAVLMAACCHPGLAGAATPALRVADFQLGVAGARVPPNLLLNLSLTFADAGAAYREAYDASLSYDGYFNARLCYRYPTGARAPDERSTYFAIAGSADGAHACSASTFSGNLMNWATASVLDLLRLGLTGGDRVVDEGGLTVLQRAWLPDGSFHPDFYAHPVHFPRKVVAPAGVLPFAADTVYIVSCRNRVLFSNTRKGGNCDAPRLGAGGRRRVSDKYFGEFVVRVQVCTPADAASRPALCRKTADGSYKPEGALQAVSERARIGVMSYLTEHGAGDPNLYGGVLRAPLGFIGATSVDAPDYLPLANHHAEWDAGSGVLARGGAIAYINQLGRSNPARLGAYRSADPGAELFYESLRYLQAQPGDGAIATDDGMPVWSDRADPVLAACQRNAVAFIGHAAFLEDRYLPGNTRADHLDRARLGGNGAFNVMQKTRRVGELEAGTGKDGAANPAPRPALRTLDLLDDGVGGAGSFYLAGAAHWAHTTAIRADKPVRVDTVALELGTPAQAGASALYLAAKYGGFDDRNGDKSPFTSAAGRSATSEWSVDGATPASFFAGTDPLRIAAATRALVAAAAGPRGSLRGSGPAPGRDAGGAFLLQTSYDQWHWSGSLQRLALEGAASGAAHVAALPTWDAAVVLDGDPARQPSTAPRPAPDARKIYTLAERAGRAVTVPFTWDSLPAPQRALIDAGDGLGEARTAFLRGERARELGRPGGVFRRRASALGDIMRSAPLLVGAPSAAPQEKTYGAFHARYRQRKAAVYAGANDGMLHAFDAADGAELFAYIPRALLPALAQLSAIDYVHRAFVDGSPSQGEALLGGRWRSVLASGMGMGARGVFALDVSDPGAFADGLGALWEFTDKDDTAMGFVSAPPVIAKLRVGTRGASGEFRYFAIVSSGINNYGPGARRLDAGGALFLLALDKAADAPWRLGENYYRIDTPAADASQANALAAPAIALAADGSVARIWAGDLQGTLWRVDTGTRPPWRATALFAARDAAGARQPITQAPRAVFAPGGGHLVLFGTGKFIEAADLLPAAYTAQSFYAVLDSAAGLAEAPLARASLAPRLLSGAAVYAVKGAPLSLTGPGAKRGWYLDFPGAREDGERLAATPVLAAGTLFIDSLLPGADACAAPATRGYALDALSGFAFGADGLAQAGASTGALTAGLAESAPVVFALSTRVGARDGSGARTATRSVALLRAGADADTQAASAELVTLTLHGGRVSWREVANWQALHAAAQK
jgi:type IV pilus assembly protein PilY1